MTNYDYIISGAGAAGLSLLMRLVDQPHFADKKILVVDKEPKSRNDHTWCFWEREAGKFESIVHHQWQYVHFYSKQFSERIDLTPYKYKMIRSIDFYNYVYSKIEGNTNVTFKYGKVEAAGNEGNKALVIVDGEKFTADYVFNSIMFTKPAIPPGKHFLLQHFKGYVIETDTPTFNPGEATLMDFRLSQEHGATFIYVLPLSETKALVEYTLFTKELLQDEQYNRALNQYIHDVLKINSYKVIEEEFGIIPMTNIEFVKRVGRVINVGTAGGQTKGSSGYTFQFIQKHSDQIIKELLEHKELNSEDKYFDKRFKKYDSILLNVLANNRISAEKIFADMFEKNPIDRVLKFLDNESTLEDEINLIATLPKGPFMKAGMEEFFK